MEYTRSRLFVDMDGTLARFHDEANYLERMFEKDFFRNLQPFENMVEGVRQFIQQHPNIEVFILSARVNGEPPYCEAEKNAWLDMYLPEIDTDHRIFTEMGRSKAEYIPGGVRETDFLLDDYNKGLNLWLYDGGSAIKCHNNINQKGLGAYGGSAGRLWTGAMVHTEDAPGMIAAELAHHMGLSYTLNYAFKHTDIDFTISHSTDRPQPVPSAAPQLICFPKKPNPERYAACRAGQSPVTFENPLNAIRWLEGKDEFTELPFHHNGQPGFVLPKFLADSMASNLYGCKDVSELAEHGQYPEDVCSAFCQAVYDSKLPIVGHIHYLGSKGQVGETAVFRSVEDMKAEVAECRECGRPIVEDWAVTPKFSEVTLSCYPDLSVPESFQLSSDNLRMAAGLCGIQYDTVDDFLSEYTWDDSLNIWNEYGQYVQKIAEIMNGFASREDVEKVFYSNVSQGLPPIEAAQLMLVNIAEWAKWHNEDAFKAGVFDKALDYHFTLRQSSLHKTALDEQISSAFDKRTNLHGSSPVQQPER